MNQDLFFSSKINISCTVRFPAPNTNIADLSEAGCLSFTISDWPPLVLLRLFSEIHFNHPKRQRSINSKKINVAIVNRMNNKLFSRSPFTRNTHVLADEWQPVTLTSFCGKLLARGIFPHAKRQFFTDHPFGWIGRTRSIKPLAYRSSTTVFHEQYHSRFVVASMCRIHLRTALFSMRHIAETRTDGI